MGTRRRRSGRAFVRRQEFAREDPRGRVRRAAVCAADALERRALLATTIVISDASVAEGNVGNVNMEFTVTRSGDLASAITVGYSTSNGTAAAGSDYIAQTGTVTIPSGLPSATISIPVIGDTIDEGDETFFVNLTGVVDVNGPAVALGARSDVTVSGSPMAVVAADVNGDGRQDLLSVQDGSSTFVVHINTTAPGAATPSFTTAGGPFTTGANPRDIAVADLNRDGKPDVVVTQAMTSSIGVFFNTTPTGSATPSFTARTDFATAGSPLPVAIADVNGDGRLDVLSANGGAGTVSVFLNTTSAGGAFPTFAPRADFNSGILPGNASLKTGDINSDGRPDVVVSDGVLLNTTPPGAASASFAAKQTLTTGASPQGVALGDVNGDGRVDVVVLRPGVSSANVFINNTAPGSGALVFIGPHVFGTAATPVAPALVDVNGDGKLDLLTAGSGANAVSVLINTTLPGRATPTFLGQATTTVGAGPEGLAVADFNGDGKRDVASANRVAGSVSVLLNMTVIGAASVTPGFAGTTVVTGTMPLAVNPADINLDGRTDLVIANQNSFSISVILNNTPPDTGVPTFAPRQDFTVGTFPDSIAIADLNGDGKPDVSVSNAASHNVSVLLNTTTPGGTTVAFAPRQDFATGTFPRAVAAADIDGDGRADLVTANLDSDNLSVFLNTTAPGALAASFAARQDFPAADGPTGLGLGDFNGDGRVDISVINQNAGSASVFLNVTGPGSSTVALAPRQDFGVNSAPRGIAVGDINGDGRPDLAIANYGATGNGNTVSTLLNTTAPGAAAAAFAAKQDLAVGAGSIHVALSDLNGDGRPDVVAANVFSNNVSVLLDQTAPGSATIAFTPQQTFGVGTNPIFVAPRDLTGDGRADLAVANFSSNNASVLPNAPAVITDNLATGTIIDDDHVDPLVSFTPITLGFPLVKWQPVPISPAAIADDPQLADMVTFDLIVTTTADWNSAGLRVVMPAGAAFYNHPQGGQTAPNPTLLPLFPALGFDTYVNGPGGFSSPPVILGPFPEGPPPAIFGLTELSVSWGDLLFSAAGEYHIARLTFSRAALAASGDFVDDLSRTTQGGSTTVSIGEAFTSDVAAEGAGVRQANVSLNVASSQPTSVPFTISGTAASGLDFTITPPPLVIPAGATQAPINLTILDDLTDEPIETVVVTLGNPTGGSTTGATLHQFTILDNDPQPTINFTAVSQSAGESAETVLITAQLSSASAFQITVPFSVSGTASSPGDYTIDPSPLTFLAGQTSRTIAVTIVNDVLDEFDETVVVTMGTPGNAQLGTATEHTLTIQDNDPTPTVSFTLASQSAAESSDVVTVVAQLSAVSGRDVTLPFSLTGTAQPGLDFTVTGSPLVIPAGQSGASIEVTLINDPLHEPDETVVVTMGAPTNAVPAVPSQHTLTILDDDPQPALLASDFHFATAPHRLSFQFSLNVSASLTTSDLLLENLTSGLVVPPSSMALSYDGQTNTATFTFPGLPGNILADGNYRATIRAQDVTDPAGNPLAADVLFNFFFLTADANHDARVNLSDFNILASNFGQQPRDFTQGDFNYDGRVNLQDFNILATRFGTVLTAPSGRGGGIAGGGGLLTGGTRADRVALRDSIFAGRTALPREFSDEVIDALDLLL